MCGIVGAVSERNVVAILLETLKRMEYRGYDSAGIAIIDKNTGILERYRQMGKIAALEELLDPQQMQTNIGIAHTRWATHGQPSLVNAHPHVSSERLALVHNGIFENHSHIRAELEEQGYTFSSQTDTEALVHLLHSFLQQPQTTILQALQQALKKIVGSYAIALVDSEEPDTIYCMKNGAPLVVGIGFNEHFVASDPNALLVVTPKFVVLEDKQIAVLKREGYEVFDQDLKPAKKKEVLMDNYTDSHDKEGHSHFMHKEIFEQPQAIERTFSGRLSKTSVLNDFIGFDEQEILAKAKHVLILACGSSYHSSLLGKMWIENLCGIPTQVELASEYLSRPKLLPTDTCVIAVSQSGETIDTLNALLEIQKLPQVSMSLCISNVINSTLFRETQVRLMTMAGHEVSVAATKSFTTQLIALAIFALSLANVQKKLQTDAAAFIESIFGLPETVNQLLSKEKLSMNLAEKLQQASSIVLIARGLLFPIALEGALKIKEISYIHAEAFAAGELKHGPLALINESIPVVCLLQNDPTAAKMLTSISEVMARSRNVHIIADAQVDIGSFEDNIYKIPQTHFLAQPILHSIFLQLVAYHTAILLGTDIDQPRNLAKSVTVE